MNKDLVILRQSLNKARSDALKAGVEWQDAMTEVAMALLTFFPEDVLETSELRLRMQQDGFMFMLVKVNKDDSTTEEDYDVC